MSSLVHSLLFSLFVFSMRTSAFSRANGPTPYELFKKNGLPVGLLPQGLTNYEVDESAGEFSIYSTQLCSFQFGETENVMVYEPVVSGSISNGRIFQLKGVAFDDGNGFLEVTDVRRLGSMISLETYETVLGTYPASQLETSPNCSGASLPLAMQTH